MPEEAERTALSERVGIFDLVNPPGEWEVETFHDTVARIDFPWRWLLPELVHAGHNAVRVYWRKQAQGVTGTYWSNSNHIELRPSTTYSNKSLSFTIAHEIGHCVSDAVLAYHPTKQAIIDLYHDSPETYRRDDEKPNGYPIEWAHVYEHSERWQGRSPTYYHRINESFADSFVQAFAPTIWSGEAEHASKHYPRFTHVTSRLDEFRDLVLSQEPRMFDDVPKDGTHTENIEDLATFGVISGTSKATFDPNGTLTRAQAATMFARLLDKTSPGWRPTG